MLQYSVPSLQLKRCSVVVMYFPHTLRVSCYSNVSLSCNWKIRVDIPSLQLKRYSNMRLSYNWNVLVTYFSSKFEILQYGIASLQPKCYGDVSLTWSFFKTDIL